MAPNSSDYETILPVEQLNCKYVLNQTSNTRKIYVLFFNGDVSVYSATMYYESMLLFEVSPATNCEHLLNQTPYTRFTFYLRRRSKWDDLKF